MTFLTFKILKESELFEFQIQIPSKVENFLFNGIILGWFALQNIFINEKFYCWNPDGNIAKEEVLANLAINKDWDIHGRDFVPSYGRRGQLDPVKSKVDDQND